MSAGFALAETLETLIEEMVAAIVSARHLPPDEVRSWAWSRLLRTYRSLARSQWEHFLTAVQTHEIATRRAIYASMSGKNPKDLPGFEKVKGTDPFDPPPPSIKSPMWAKYLAANGLER